MNFSDIRNHLYDRAERYWYISLSLGLAVQIIAISTTYIRNNIFTASATTVLFITPILARWFQEKSKDDTLKAMTCRLAILYSDTLGDDIPQDISREIKSWVDEAKLVKAPFKRPYYDSKLQVGANRLADVVSESAFWTYKLAGDMRLIMFLYTGIYLLTAITFMCLLFQLRLDSSVIVGAAKIIIALISLVFTSEAVLLITQYNELYAEAKRLYAITAKMVIDNNLKIQDILQTVEGYNILLISSPPIPSRLYKFRQNALNKAYKKVVQKE